MSRGEEVIFWIQLTVGVLFIGLAFLFMLGLMILGVQFVWGEILR